MDEYKIKEYLEKPYNCLYCDSENLMINHTEKFSELNELHEFVQCDNCKKTWIDIYEFKLKKVLI